MASTPWLFSKNPDADFSRSRKLDFASTIQFILSMESGSLKKNYWIIFTFPLKHLPLRLLVSKEASCSQKHSPFYLMNLILFFLFKGITMDKSLRNEMGIETSFRELKYAIGLSCFHSKKMEYIKQEIYARLILYNYCEIITIHVVIHQKDTKHIYQITTQWQSIYAVISCGMIFLHLMLKN